MQQQKKEGRLSFFEGRKSKVIIFRDSSIKPLNIKATTITETKLPLLKIGRLRITYSVNATGSTATSPSRLAQNSYLILISGMVSAKTMNTMMNNAKHSAIGAKMLMV